MKHTRTFKLVYQWIKYPPNRKHFQRYNASLNRAENVVKLEFNNSSALDKATILARCKAELGLNVNPFQIFEFDKETKQYKFLKENKNDRLSKLI